MKTHSLNEAQRHTAGIPGREAQKSLSCLGNISGPTPSHTHTQTIHRPRRTVTVGEGPGLLGPGLRGWPAATTHRSPSLQMLGSGFILASPGHYVEEQDIHITGNSSPAHWASLCHTSAGSWSFKYGKNGVRCPQEEGEPESFPASMHQSLKLTLNSRKGGATAELGERSCGCCYLL